MKSILVFLAAAICALFAPLSIDAKVLVVVDNDYYAAADSYLAKYFSDVRKIDHKQLAVRVFLNSSVGSTQERCLRLWRLVRDEYLASRSASRPEERLEGAVLVGNLPVPWLDEGGGQYLPDDRYFMDLYDSVAHRCYTSDSEAWDFSEASNSFTGYRGDRVLDIWVSRVMAQQIRGLRDGLDVLDEYTILNEYFKRVHERMTEPAKVPPRGFAMGGISEWPEHDPIEKFGFLELNLKNIFRFDFPEDLPSNWLLQLVWGPRGGTSLGAFNGQRYPDIGGNNHTILYSKLYDCKSQSTVEIGAADTMGYEWAGIFEHSFSSGHSFNYSDGTPFGRFCDAAKGVLWGPQWLSTSTNGDYFKGSSYVYNNSYSPDPWNYGLWRAASGTFKAKVPRGGTYHVYLYYPARSSNCSSVWVRVYSWPNDYNFINGLGNQYNFSLDQSQHLQAESPGSNWELVGDCDLRENDSAWITLDNGGYAGDLIVDAVKLVEESGSPAMTVDNEDPGFASNTWYDRNFLDMQDEDPRYHKAYSKVPFFISSGCEVGLYTDCYNPQDVSHAALRDDIRNNLGLLYGMSQSGLISLSTAIMYPGYYAYPFTPYMHALAGKNSYGQPSTFGDALLALFNSPWYIDMGYVLIGAGTLKADAYIPYGTRMMKLTNMQVSKSAAYKQQGKLVWLEDFAVLASGNCTVRGREVRLYPECDLKGQVRIAAAQ